MTRYASAGLVGDVVEVARTHHGHLLATPDRWDGVHLVDYLVNVPLSSANATHVTLDGDLMSVLYSPTSGYYVFVALGATADAEVEGRPVDLADLREAVAACWCGMPGSYRVPVDPEVTAPDTVMSDGEPGMTVCPAHVDRDGYEGLL